MLDAQPMPPPPNKHERGDTADEHYRRKSNMTKSALDITHEDAAKELYSALSLVAAGCSCAIDDGGLVTCDTPSPSSISICPTVWRSGRERVCVRVNRPSAGTQECVWLLLVVISTHARTSMRSCACMVHGPVGDVVTLSLRATNMC